MITAALSLALLLVASLAGLALSRRLPWSSAAYDGRQDLAVGLALGPALAGLAAILVLKFMPGRAPGLQLAVIYALLAALAASLFVSRDARPVRAMFMQGSVAPWTLALLALAMLVQVVYSPLSQNDALEYATVGRILLDARALDAYPAIDPSASTSGFYGPWTHPPLYVAQIFLADLIQGTADSPRLMRFIAPWCLLTAGLCVGSLAASCGRVAATAAVALLVGVPVLFFGAMGALIDALPVSALLIALVGAVGLERGWRGGAALGVLMGVGLWSHSEAVLFPFLLFPALALIPAPGATANLRTSFADALRAAVVGIPLMAVIAVAPYARNMKLFGSPVSDTPAVFGYGPLQFNEYFSLQRGFDSVVDDVQYGLFKGFFAIESYSFTFWLALCALPIALRAVARSVMGEGVPTPAERVIASSAIVTCGYFAIVVLTLALGVDVMVRNDRYLAVVAPCVALLGGAALQELWLPALLARRRVASVPPGSIARAVLVHGLVLLMVFQVLLGYLRQNGVRPGVAALDDASQLAPWPQFATVGEFRERVEPDGVVLSMRPADLYYGGRRMVSYLDPRMIPFYAATTSDEALARLRELAVTHVHLPDYYLPTVYNSRLMEVLADPALAALEVDHLGYQLYELRGAAPRPVLVRISVPQQGWSLARSAVLGGPKSRVRLGLGTRRYAPRDPSENTGLAGMFHHEIAHQIFAPAMELPPTDCAPHRVELTLRAAIRGRAHVAMFARLRRADGAEAASIALADRSLVDPRVSAPLARRMLLPPGVRSVQVGFDHRGGTQMSVDSLMLELTCNRSE